MKRPVLLALWLALFSVTGLSGAKEEASPDKGQSKDSWASSRLDVDKEVDDGAEDGKNGGDAESGKFSKDKDDTYSDNLTDQGDWLKSRFEEDADNDVDTDTDRDSQNASNG